MNDTSANGIHTSGGKFAAGNPGGPGNPHGGQVARLRAAMLEAVSEDDMRAVVLKLVELAHPASSPAENMLPDGVVRRMRLGFTERSTVVACSLSLPHSLNRPPVIQGVNNVDLPKQR